MNDLNGVKDGVNECLGRILSSIDNVVREGVAVRDSAHVYSSLDLEVTIVSP